MWSLFISGVASSSLASFLSTVLCQPAEDEWAPVSHTHSVYTRICTNTDDRRLREKNEPRLLWASPHKRRISLVGFPKWNPGSLVSPSGLGWLIGKACNPLSHFVWRMDQSRALLLGGTTFQNIPRKGEQHVSIFCVMQAQ